MAERYNCVPEVLRMKSLVHSSSEFNIPNLIRFIISLPEETIILLSLPTAILSFFFLAVSFVYELSNFFSYCDKNTEYAIYPFKKIYVYNPLLLTIGAML